MTCRRGPGYRWVLLLLWAGMVGCCLIWQSRFELTPGDSVTRAAPQVIDELQRGAPATPIVVIGVHPRCPCSMASLSELAELAFNLPPGVDMVALVATPEDAGTEWTEAAACARAREIAGLRVVFDPGGRLCETLGMLTSGHVVAYDAQREPIVSGGITPARGQTGANPGLLALRAAIGLTGIGGEGATVSRRTTPVFGCPLPTPSCDTRRQGADQ